MTKFRTVEDREAHYREYNRNYNKMYRARNLERCKKTEKAWKDMHRSEINEKERLRVAAKKLEKIEAKKH